MEFTSVDAAIGDVINKNVIRKSVSRRNRCGTRTWQPKSIIKDETVRTLVLRSFAENLLNNKIGKVNPMVDTIKNLIESSGFIGHALADKIERLYKVDPFSKENRTNAIKTPVKYRKSVLSANDKFLSLIAEFECATKITGIT